MNNEVYIDQQLDIWLDGELDDAATDRLLRDAAAANPAGERELHRAAAQVIIAWSSRDEVAAVHREFLQDRNRMSLATKTKEKAKLARMYPRKWMVVKVAAVLLVAISGWLGVMYMQTSSGRLYTELFQAYEVNTDRGWENMTVHHMLQSFREKKYTEVVQQYRSIAKPDSRENFLAGYSWLQLNEAGSAEAAFRRILEDNRRTGPRLYQDEAEFYLGLACLQQKKNAEARAVFNSIAKDPQHTYHKRVSKWALTRMKWLK